MNKVFVVNNTRHDLSPAEVYGKVVPMTNGPINKYNTARMERAFAEHIDQSSSEDFLIHAGPCIMNVIASAMFVAKHGRLNLLIWKVEEDGTSRYVLRTLYYPEVKYKETEERDKRDES